MVAIVRKVGGRSKYEGQAVMAPCSWLCDGANHVYKEAEHAEEHRMVPCIVRGYDFSEERGKALLLI